MANLVLGVSIGMSDDSSDIFVKSIRRSGYSGDVVILFDAISEQQKAMLDKYGIEYRTGYTKPSNFFVGRWKLYESILNTGKWDRILVSDLRDVVFQGVITPHLDRGLHVTLESANIGQEQYNCSWIEVYGDDVLKALSDKTIICAGTVWGDTESILKVCEIMSQDGHRMDQGALNWSVYAKSLPASVHPNGEVVWTLAMEGYSFSENILHECEYSVVGGKIVMPNGHAPCVLHQYTRHAKLNGIIREIYS